MENNIYYNSEFFPTPTDIIKRMIEPYTKQLYAGASVLEPSAGNGAILDYLTSQHGGYRGWCDKKNVYAIEQDANLVFALQGKGYKVIADDFLSYHPLHRFDFIFMNPPFNNGDAHLLHAWEIMSVGTIVCLLNSETLNNPFSKKRQMLQNIISQYGSVEELGPCFMSADRKTNVNVVLVRLVKNEPDNLLEIDLGDDAAIEDTPDLTDMLADISSVATNDQLGAYLRSWHKAREAAVEYLKAYRKLSLYVTPFISPREIITSVNKELQEYHNISSAYNLFVDEVKSAAWRRIIDKLEMDKYMTYNLRQNFNQFCASQGAYELDRENVMRLLQFVCLNIKNIMHQAVVDVYDTFCKYYAGNGNHIEGWKTNSRYKVNKKLILPKFVESAFYGNPQKWGYFRYYRVCDSYNVYYDIDKVMCYLTGMDYNILDKCDEHTGVVQHHSLLNSIQQVRVGDTEWNESEFFRFKCFKKGTVHLEFKSEDLWAKFNLAVNEGKKELGE